MSHQIPRALRPLTLLLAGVFAVAILAGCSLDQDREAIPQPTISASGIPVDTKASSTETRLVRVVDGDTIVVQPVAGVLHPTNDAGTQSTVRLLGIDAAEMNYGKATGPECGAQEATDNLEKLLPAGSPVTITFDARADRTDRFGRSLAYVGSSTGDDINLAQVTKGYAEAWYPKGEPEPERVPAYKKAAVAASQQGLGAQGSCASIGR